MLDKKKFLFWSIVLISFGSCTLPVSRSPHILKADEYFQNRRFAQALDIIRPRTINAKEKDRLLYLMEAGSILHAMQNWEKSNLAFGEADALAEEIHLSRGKEILAFFINKKEQNFIGENFERVKIKLYLALNYLMLEEKGRALAFLRALNQELADIRFEGNDYKQNFAARYLGAILAEEERDYNYARVQYNNMLAAGVYQDLAERSLYWLALLEKDSDDLEKYASRDEEMSGYDLQTNRFPLSSLASPENEVGSLVLIHEAGIAPYKVPKGKIKDEPLFQAAFHTALITALVSESHAGLNATLLLSLVGESQNPVPVYEERKTKNLVTTPIMKVDGYPFVPEVMDDYAATVFHNYNDKYQDYVNYNIANITTRVLAVYLASVAVRSREGELSELLGLLINLGGGAAIHALLQPDLRSWNLTYSNLQMKRIFLKPGEYSLALETETLNYLSKIPEQITIEPGKNTFVLLKTF